jgi:hypothetical protein
MTRPLRSLSVFAACGLLLAAGAAEAAGKAPKHLAKDAASPKIEAHYTDSGPEPLLAKVFDAIEGNRLDVAMQQTEMLIKAYPNFRLAHLVMGDLLLARSRPLMAFGEGGGPGAGEKVADLRDEAIVRLKGYRTKPPADYVPRYLLQMHPEQKHAVVVDTQKSRLYLYQNDNGTPRFIADYYISQGKLGAEKAREGDKKTPIGVYHVTSSLPRQKLTDFYGSGAFPINYPNDWDKRQGRNGHGIWLHGTPVRHLLAPAESLRRLRGAGQPGPRFTVEEPAGRADAGDYQQQHRVAVHGRLAERAQFAAEDDRRMATGLGKPRRRSVRAALLDPVQGRRPGLPGLGRAEAQGQRREELDQGGYRQHQHVPQSRQGRARRRHLRAGLPFQQPVQPDEEAPVLDQGRRSLEDRLRRRRLGPPFALPPSPFPVFNGGSMHRLFLLVFAFLFSVTAHAANPQLEVKTSQGTLLIELYQDKAPKSVENFLQYAKDGFFNGTIFHRVIPDFMIQGGGFTAGHEAEGNPRHDPE